MSSSSPFRAPVCSMRTDALFYYTASSGSVANVRAFTLAWQRRLELMAGLHAHSYRVRVVPEPASRDRSSGRRQRKVIEKDPRCAIQSAILSEAYLPSSLLLTVHRNLHLRDRSSREEPGREHLHERSRRRPRRCHRSASADAREFSRIFFRKTPLCEDCRVTRGCWNIRLD